MGAMRTIAWVVAMVGLGCWRGSVFAATPEQKYEAAKITAAGKTQTCLTAERAKGVKGQTPNYAKSREAFEEAFDKAEDKAGPGVCPTEGDAAAIEALIDTCFDDIKTGSSACATNLATCTANLGTCNADLSQAQGDLSVFTAQLAACQQLPSTQFPATGQTTCWAAMRSSPPARAPGTTARSRRGRR
jgi:hypothetical protein